MSDDLLPEDNRLYATQEYWDSRYKKYGSSFIHSCLAYVYEENKEKNTNGSWVTGDLETFCGLC